MSRFFKLSKGHSNDIPSQNSSLQSATPAIDNTGVTNRHDIDRNRRSLNPSPRDSPEDTPISANDSQVKRGKRATVKRGTEETGQAPSKKRPRSQVDSISIETSDLRPVSTRTRNGTSGSQPASSSRLPTRQRKSARLLSQEPSILSPRPVKQKTTVAGRRVSHLPTSGGPSDRDAKAKRAVSSDQTAEAATGPQVPTFASVNLPNDNTLQPLLCLLEKTGSGYYHLCQYELMACLKAFRSLPIEQQATPWVLSKVARAQYESSKYEDAKSTFQALRNAAPAWMEELEIYSTTLWCLKDEVGLSFLAHELTDNHNQSPQTWCAVGNLFCLRFNHVKALEYFQHASGLSPQLAHAKTLLGHEHLELCQYDKATAAFREVLEIDVRNFAAWVGLGRVREKLKEHDKALRHYQAAETINASNAVLMMHIANVSEKKLDIGCTVR